jgi:hypothetical protein
MTFPPREFFSCRGVKRVQPFVTCSFNKEVHMEASIPRAPGKVLSETRATEGHRTAESRQEKHMQHVVSQIEEALRSLRFGQVTITVQDGVVVQIDRLERTRLSRGSD